MRSKSHGPLYRLRSVGWALCLSGAAALQGQTAPGLECTTQAKLTLAQRTEIGAVAYRLAKAVASGDAAAVRELTVAQYAADFAATASLVRTTAADVAGDTLAVTQVYLLDASRRSPSDGSDADFSCPLAASAAETDFSISGLPPGRYAFVMVEAAGGRPWLLSFLLQAVPDGWRMAGFYPHGKDAAGHSGVWYWTTARSDAKDGREWLAWVLYGEADALLRPANFVSSTNLDRLRSELRSITPPSLADGLSSKTPLMLTGQGGTYKVTGLNSEGTPDGRQLNLVLHIESQGAGADFQAATARNLAAATALLAAHPELRSGFDNLWIVAEAAGSNPFVTQRSMAGIGAAK